MHLICRFKSLNLRTTSVIVVNVVPCCDHNQHATCFIVDHCQIMCIETVFDELILDEFKSLFIETCSFDVSYNENISLFLSIGHQKSCRVD